MSRKALFPSGQENRTGGPTNPGTVQLFEKGTALTIILRNSEENRSVLPLELL